VGWSEEDKRAEVMREFLYLALTCDLTRAATLQITFRQSYLNTERICGVGTSVHAGNHGIVPGAQGADIIAWHVEQFAWLVKALKTTMDVDGRPMIDNTVLILGPEGGAGYISESGHPFGNHSTENMSVLVAGGRAMGLQPGRHIAKGNKVHPAAVLRTAMRAVGVDRPLGEITDTVADL
jgi:hypothetical protein